MSRKRQAFGGVSFCASLLACMVLIQFTLSTQGCKKKDEEEPAATENPPVGVVDDVSFWVRAMVSEDYDFKTHAAPWNASQARFSEFQWDKECKIIPGTSISSKEANILCLVEGMETDLFYYGLTLQYNVPREMCEYFTFRQPYYYVWPVGYGPSEVKFYTDNAGVHDVKNSITGSPYCPYDYTDVKGPNCCLGKYMLIVGAPNESGTVVYGRPSEVSWGGDLGTCLGGPATDTQAKDENGLPRYDIENINSIGLNKAYTIKSPLLTPQGGKGFGNNFFVANYFPLSNTTLPGGKFDIMSMAQNNAPKGFNPKNPSVIVPPSGGVLGPYDGTLHYYSTNPIFEFTCYNRALEAKAKISLMIRSWDYRTWTELTTYGSTPGDETYFPGPLHDFAIWPDIKGDASPWSQILQNYPAETDFRHGFPMGHQ